MTRAWLDQRYRQATGDGVYVAHQPIYGLGHAACEPGHLARMARTYQILKVLNRLSFESVLDVGASEGYLASLVRDLFGAQVVAGDLSAQAGQRANELFGLESVAFDCARLPFRDEDFDLVICSEVLEHVEFPVDVMIELERVTGRALVLTTEEVTGDEAKLAEHSAGRRDLPHSERNLFHIDDLKLMYGAESACRSEFCGAAPADTISVEEAAEWIRTATDVDHWDPNGLGVVLTFLRGEGHECEPRVPEEELLQAVLKTACEPKSIGAPDAVTTPTAHREELRTKMCCPLCSGRLRWSDDEAHPINCANCGRKYTEIGGVPALYDENAPDPSSMDLESHLWVENDDSDRIEAIMELYDRLEVPSAGKHLNWSFDSEDSRKAWTAGNDLTARDGSGSSWQANGEDPWLVGPLLELPEAGGLELAIEMRIHNPDFPADAGVGQIYWMGMGNLTFQESHSIQFPVINDGEVHTYRIPVAEHEAWPGDGGLWLRFDPVNGPAEVDLLSIELCTVEPKHADGGS